MLVAVVCIVLAVLLLDPGGGFSRVRRSPPDRRQDAAAASEVRANPAADDAPAASMSGGARARMPFVSVRAAPTPAPLPGPLLLELLASLLESGSPPTAAVRTAGAVLAAGDDPRGDALLTLAACLEQGIPPPVPKATPGRSKNSAPARPLMRASSSSRSRSGDRPASGGPAPADAALGTLADALDMAQRAGLPPAALVRRAAAEERRRLSAAQRRAVRRLEVLLVLPVGLCLLPAFVLLGIVPMVVDLFTG